MPSCNFKIVHISDKFSTLHVNAGAGGSVPDGVRGGVRAVHGGGGAARGAAGDGAGLVPGAPPVAGVRARGVRLVRPRALRRHPARRRPRHDDPRPQRRQGRALPFLLALPRRKKRVAKREFQVLYVSKK